MVAPWYSAVSLNTHTVVVWPPNLLMPVKLMSFPLCSCWNRLLPAQETSHDQSEQSLKKLSSLRVTCYQAGPRWSARPPVTAGKSRWSCCWLKMICHVWVTVDVCWWILIMDLIHCTPLQFHFNIISLNFKPVEGNWCHWIPLDKWHKQRRGLEQPFQRLKVECNDFVLLRWAGEGMEKGNRLDEGSGEECKSKQCKIRC